MVEENERTGMTFAREVFERFIRAKVEYQAKLKHEVTHEEFLSALLDAWEK